MRFEKRETVRLAALTLGLGLASCVPTDEALDLGSVAFHVTASERTRRGLSTEESVDGWALRFDRVVLGFKTMTIGTFGDEDTCAYRGRGAASNVVFDPLRGVVQTFNGLRPVACPDVGVILGPPDDATTLAGGATWDDLVELASDEPAHAVVEATAWRDARPGGGRDRVRIALRFDTARTSAMFGGCRAATERGVRAVAGEREEVRVRFAAEALFREAISTTAGVRVQPFVQADARGDDDGVVTMDDLDALPLADVFGEFYQLPNGSRAGSLGDYVRTLFRFTLGFREAGLCVGHEVATPAAP